MTTEKIQNGFDVFLHDGDNAIGAVRKVTALEITVYIENAGDFAVPRSAVKDVHSEKVILETDQISSELKRAIGRAHRGEEPST